MKIHHGNIANAEEPFILQQYDCLTTIPHGLSKTLSANFDHARVYEKRRAINTVRNCAIPEDRSVPGTIEIYSGSVYQPDIICLYGQYRPGKVNAYNVYPEDYPDTSQDREKYFQQGLDRILNTFIIDEANGYPKIAVPYRIGCGLAGGDWIKYLTMIKEFDRKLQQHGGEVVIYYLEKPFSE